MVPPFVGGPVYHNRDKLKCAHGPATGRRVCHPGGGQPPEPVSQRASQTIWAIRARYDDSAGAFRAKNTLWNAGMRLSREKLHVLCTYPVYVLCSSTFFPL